MSDDELKGFSESLKILDTTLDLATLVLPLYCVKSLLIKVLLAWLDTLPLQYYELSLGLAYPGLSDI